MPTYFDFIESLLVGLGATCLTCRRPIGHNLLNSGNMGGRASAMSGSDDAGLLDCSHIMRDCRVSGGGGRGAAPRPSTRRAPRPGDAVDRDETETARNRPWR